MFLDARRSPLGVPSSLNSGGDRQPPSSDGDGEFDEIPENLTRASRAGINPLRVLVALGLDPARFERHVVGSAHDPGG